MNNINLIGRLTKDPELRKTNNGKSVATFTIAVQDGKDKAYFIDCVAWEQQADLVSKYFTKGKQIGITGKLTNRTYDSKDGHKVKVTEVVVREITFIDDKREEQKATDFNVKGKDYGFNTGSVAADIANDDLPF
jgi:single-strand DNA-binding protein